MRYVINRIENPPLASAYGQLYWGSVNVLALLMERPVLPLGSKLQ